jgi:hypothetical protein
MENDFDSTIHNKSLMSNAGYWLTYIFCIFILSLVSLSITSMIICNKPKQNLINIHVIVYCLVTLSSALFFNGYTKMAICITLVHFSIALIAYFLNSTLKEI